ncbi:MAG TPA: primosomal protein N' [Fervidobacterium sp.]|nr:primosomal protein N' [Fervidobacterium sp.]HPT53352.1 primosomal protein N' [Fervidobacterium sp.]
MFYLVAISRTNFGELFVYSSKEDIEIGERVVVPFRNKRTIGYVVDKSESTNVFIQKELIEEQPERIKEIDERLDYMSFLEPWRVQTILKTAAHYGSGVGKYYDLCFPPKFDDYFILFVESTNPLLNIQNMKYEEFKKIPSSKEYIRSGQVRIYRDFESRKPRPREEKYVSLNISTDTVAALKLTVQQSIVLNYLLLNGIAELGQLLEDTEVKRDVIVQLQNRGIIKVSDSNDLSCVDDATTNSRKTMLTQEQSGVVENILKLQSSKSSISRLSENVANAQKHLLYGPTGSGKTEVYLEVIDKYLLFGSVLYLVPEISLTEQTLARLRKRFPELSIAVYHSYLTDAKRVEIWSKAVKGEIDILIGPRSALFIPMKNLRLVIVDEEHDDSYYNNHEPFYEIHYILDQFPVDVIYGSATPSLDSYAQAREKRYHFHILKERFGVELPDVEVIDMRDEKKISPSISESLYNEMMETIKTDRSALIFTRRKGFSRVQCAVCGYIMKCDHCDVSLTYHMEKNELKCHLCGEKKTFTSTCPNCGSTMLVDRGTGTEKIEKELMYLFPGRKIGRLDAEIIDEPKKMKEVLEKLREGELDIVTGTKMITKGLDIYRIGLVGIVDIDALISYPDINAPLRTFQTLVQVIGRSGRRDKGKAVIQTYNPGNTIIKCAKLQDIDSYYDYELKLREELNYPPFADMIQIIYANVNITIAEETIDVFSRELENYEELYISMLGPSEHPIFRVAGKYRYQVILKTSTVEKLLKTINTIKSKYPGDWTIRVNPPNI